MSCIARGSRASVSSVAGIAVVRSFGTYISFTRRFRFPSCPTGARPWIFRCRLPGYRLGLIEELALHH
eukprot:1212321-Pyramimonas_sp.AAC.1